MLAQSLCLKTLSKPSLKLLLKDGSKMTPYRVIFDTPGLIDMAAVKTFGVNAKINENPIGYFGTGLKYAIAIALRNGAKVGILRGTDGYSFEAREVLVRDKPFNFVYCNDEPLAFTTDLGKNWEPWMALRELYSNTLDESGTVTVQEEWAPPVEGQTRIIIASELFGRLWAEQRDTFILSSKPLATSDTVDIHPGQTHHLYYNGVRAYTSEKPFLFTYNIKSHLTLTEDRTIAWIWQAQDTLYRSFLLQTDKTVLRQIFNRKSRDDHETFAEFDFNYPPEYEVSEEALLVIRELQNSQKTSLAGGLRAYYERDELNNLIRTVVELTETEQTVLQDADRILAATGLTLCFKEILVTEYLNEQHRIHVSNCGPGLGFKLSQGALVLAISPSSKSLFIARSTVMQGVQAVIDAYLEAWQEEQYESKTELRQAYVSAFIYLRTFTSYTAPTIERDLPDANDFL